MTNLYDGLPLNTPTVVFTQPGDFMLVATRTLNGGTVATVAIPGGPSDLAAQAQVNAATIQQRVAANLTTLETFISNNPAGAVLTAAQVNVVARMLAGLCRLLLQQTGTVGGS
jgi:hypothetical protein